jgi:dolichol-phosphate mannosyltransferase
LLISLSIVYKKFKWGYEVIGWTSVIVTILFLGGIILTILGIIGVYLGRTFQEVKRRPLYIISEKTN